MKLLLTLALILVTHCLQAQDADTIITGISAPTDQELTNIVVDRDEFAAGEQKLDKKVDLSSHRLFPPSIDQDETMTCVPFTISYALVTFFQATDHNRNIYDNNGQPIDSFIYSPSFLYNYLIDSEDGCKQSISVVKALETLNSIGTVSIKEMPFNFDAKPCRKPDKEMIKVAKRNRIANFYMLSDNPRYERGDIIYRMKKRLMSKSPIIIATYLDKNWKPGGKFDSHDYLANGELIWEKPASGDYGLHAMLVVGYDDSKGAKGAFKVMNSMGPDWGNRGYIWISYKVMKKNTPWRFVANDLSSYWERQEMNIDSFESADLGKIERVNSKNEYESIYAGSIAENEYARFSDYQIFAIGSQEELKARNTYLVVTEEDTTVFQHLEANQAQILIKDGKRINFMVANEINGGNTSFKFEVEDLVTPWVKAIRKKFPIKLSKWQSDKIGSRPWRFRDIVANLHESGTFEATGTVTSKDTSGVHGQLVFQILDKKNNTLCIIRSDSFGAKDTQPGGEKRRDIFFKTKIEDPLVIINAHRIKVNAVEGNLPAEVIIKTDSLDNWPSDLLSIGVSPSKFWETLNQK